MKKTLLSILLTAMTAVGFCQTFTNGVYIKNGITCEVDRKVHQITTPETLHFSNELIVKTYTNTDFTINSFFQEVSDIDKMPHKAKLGASSFAASMMNGTAVIIYAGSTNENSSCVISTPMSDLELYKGTFYFKVSENKVIVFVLDGQLKAHGEKKKENTVTAGYAVLAMPNDIGILEDNISLGAEKVRVDTIKKLTDEVQDVVKLQNQFLFITINGKTIGVDMN